MPSEIEIKFKVESIAALVTKLRTLAFVRITPRTHEMNVLFDLPGKPLRARGEVLRLRKYGETWTLTHKGKSNAKGPHKVRVETETRVEGGEQMEEILRSLQFQPSFRYEKFRAEWKLDPGHVVIDETPIGNFGEIEGPSEWIESIAQQLGLVRSDYITETYAGLFLAWKKRTGSSAKEMTFAAVAGM